MTVTIDEDTRRSFAEAEAEKAERAEDLAGRYEERAGRAQGSSDCGPRRGAAWTPSRSGSR